MYCRIWLIGLCLCTWMTFSSLLKLRRSTPHSVCARMQAREISVCKSIGMWVPHIIPFFLFLFCSWSLKTAAVLSRLCQLLLSVHNKAIVGTLRREARSPLRVSQVLMPAQTTDSMFPIPCSHMCWNGLTLPTSPIIQGSSELFDAATMVLVVHLRERHM